jgi:dCTP deaminase
MSVLSKPEILKYLEDGVIVIDPFDPANLSSSSYDVRLGKYFYRQDVFEHGQTFNPFHQKSVRQMYSKLQEAKPISNIKSKLNPLYNLSAKDKIILIAPGETILAHTIEFIGGRSNNEVAVTTEMKARSSLGRIGIAVCKCAGWGDVGYICRWTMEITNFSSAIIPLPVGLRIAQIIFHKVSPIQQKDIYKGKYQKSFDLEKIKRTWKPEDMLPALYKDRDLGSLHKYHKF